MVNKTSTKKPVAKPATKPAVKATTKAAVKPATKPVVKTENKCPDCKHAKCTCSATKECSSKESCKSKCKCKCICKRGKCLLTLLVIALGLWIAGSLYCKHITANYIKENIGTAATYDSISAFVMPFDFKVKVNNIKFDGIKQASNVYVDFSVFQPHTVKIDITDLIKKTSSVQSSATYKNTTELKSGKVILHFDDGKINKVGFVAKNLLFTQTPVQANNTNPALPVEKQSMESLVVKIEMLNQSPDTLAIRIKNMKDLTTANKFNKIDLIKVKFSQLSSLKNMMTDINAIPTVKLDELSVIINDLKLKASGDFYKKTDINIKISQYKTFLTNFKDKIGKIIPSMKDDNKVKAYVPNYMVNDNINIHVTSDAEGNFYANDKLIATNQDVQQTLRLLMFYGIMMSHSAE